MRWDAQGIEVDDGALPGLERIGFVRSVQTPQFDGITFHEVLCKSALNKIPNAAMLPFRYTVHGYRGCSHACRYCFARPTHEYLDFNCGNDFDTQIVVKTNIAEVLRRCGDGSYLSRFGGVPVRVIDARITLSTAAGRRTGLCRLVTSLQDERRHPAGSLAELYHERWEIETALDELKTHLRGAQIVLRSKTPDLVKQEFYGLLMAHFAIRGLMHEAAMRADEDPDRLSFVHAVRVVQRRLPRSVSIPPSADHRVS